MSPQHGMTRRDFVLAAAAAAGVSHSRLKHLGAAPVQTTVAEEEAREIYRRAMVIEGLCRSRDDDQWWLSHAACLRAKQLP